MCFRPRLKTNLLRIVTTAVRNASSRLLVRSNRQSERPEISGLPGDRKQASEISGCRRIELARLLAYEYDDLRAFISNPSQPTP